MGYQQSHPNPQRSRTGALDAGVPARVGGTREPSRRKLAADELLDTIPMRRTGLGTILAIVAAVLVIGGLAAYSVFGGKGTGSDQVQQIKAKAARSAEPASDLSLEEQREHIAISRRAMQQVQSEEQHKQGERAAEQGGAAGQTKIHKETPAQAGPRAPVTGTKANKAAGSLEAIGDDIASQLGGP
jgi:hypothetical protein